MGVSQIFCPVETNGSHCVSRLANEFKNKNDTVIHLKERGWIESLYLEAQAKITEEADGFTVSERFTVKPKASLDITGHLTDRCEETIHNKEHLFKEVMKSTKQKTVVPRIQAFGRGRPRKKSFGKKGGSSDKQSQDGNENGEGRTNRGRQQRNGGQGNGGNGGKRRKDDDDRDDDNDDVDDEFDDNNEDDEDDEDEQTGAESAAEESEMTPEQEAAMAQELLCLIPPKDLNCDPPEKPAKPGTAVDLHGVVLHETTGGLVVLNVRWRNKIYSGALIDVKKSKWASERIKPDPFPESANPKTPDLLRLSGKRKAKKSKSPDLSDKEAKGSTDQKTDQTFKEPTGVPMIFKKPQDSNGNENVESCSKKKARMSPPLIECPEPNCGKRYSHKNGLKYHQAHAHQKKDEIEGAGGGDKTTKIDTISSISVRECSNDTEDIKPQFPQQSILDLQDNQQNPSDTEKIVQTSNTFGTSIPTEHPLSAVESDKAPMMSQVNVKSEEESALESIKDVQFEAGDKSMKISQTDKDVPQIVLETVTGEELTEIQNGAKLSEIDRPDKLFSASNAIGLAPFTSRSSLNYSQFSPTLASLNPQMLNNSLSNALQTAVSKTDEKMYKANQETNQQEEDDTQAQTEDKERPKLDLSTQTNSEDSLKSNEDRLIKKYGLGRNVKSEDIVPSSPDECTAPNDMLPGSLGLHLFQKHATTSNASQSQPAQNDSSNFPSSLFSVSLYNQIRQEQAARLFTGADAVTGDLAEPSDIQKAISQVDVRRHFSPMLLNYLNTSARGKETSSTEGGELQVVDEVTTTGKNDEATNKSGRKLENRDRHGSSSSFQQITSKPEASYRKERNNDYRPNSGNMASKAEFLQPNISAGRPICRPVTKPDSITGGMKMTAALQRLPLHGSASSHSASDYRTDELDQSTAFKFATSSDRISPQSSGKQGNLPHLPSSLTTGDRSIGCDKSEKTKGSSPSSYLDKTLIEAKTWVPQEIYRQPAKTIASQDRAQFSPGKERQNMSTKMVDLGRKAGSPYEHGGQSSGAQTTERSDAIVTVGGKKVKAAVPAQYSIAAASNTESVAGNNQETSTNENDTSTEGSEISRFSLTSDRLVPSPAESRGRPRKIRVEKTQQIPVGSAKDLEISRGASDHSARKQPATTTCSYTRTSVIHSMPSNMEEMRTGIPVKEEYVSPDGKRKMSPNEQERLLSEKKMKQDFKKSEASRIFEAEREKLKNRYVESHYANEVRNMHLRVNELPIGPKSEQAMRRSVSPGLSRLSSGPTVNMDKAERLARERMEGKVVPMSPAFGQSSSYPNHPSSEMEKFRMEYFQHDVARMQSPFVGSLLPTAEGYPGMASSFPNSSYFRHRPALSQAEALAHHRFEQLMSSHMDHDKAFAKYSVDKSDLGLKLGPEHTKPMSQERMRPSSGESHSHHPPYYHQASPIGYQNRDAGRHSRSPKSSPFNFRTGDMFSTSRSQRMEADGPPKDSKSSNVDSRRDIRREYRPPYGSPFSQPAFQYPNLTSNVPGKSYPQHLGEQRSPYKHTVDGDKSRFAAHSSSQAQSGGMLSANLVLTKADGLGFGSVPYDNRNQDAKK